MSLEEVCNLMFNNYQKRIRIQLLRGEIVNIVSEADFMHERGSFSEDTYYAAPQHDISVIEMVLAKAYSPLADRGNIIYHINEVRRRCKEVDGYVHQMTQLRNQVMSCRELEHEILF